MANKCQKLWWLYPKGIQTSLQAINKDRLKYECHTSVGLFAVKTLLKSRKRKDGMGGRIGEGITGEKPKLLSVYLPTLPFTFIFLSFIFYSFLLASPII